MIFYMNSVIKIRKIDAHSKIIKGEKDKFIMNTHLKLEYLELRVRPGIIPFASEEKLLC